MKYHNLLKSIQHINNGAAPDAGFLASLCQIPEKDLKGFNIPEDLKEFFTQIGLPEKIQFIRDPEEGKEEEIPEVYFSLDRFAIRKIENAEYLSIGGWRIEEQISHEIHEGDICRELKDTYEGEYLINTSSKDVWFANYFDLKQVGDTWYFTDMDLELQFVNSSIEQFILSMACWKSFYPQLEKKYLEMDSDWEYILEHDELYEPFKNIMQILDPRALEGEVDHWSFMCDLSLY